MIVEWKALASNRKQVFVPLFYESGTHIEVCLFLCLCVKYPLLHISTSILLQFAIKQTIKLIQVCSDNFFLFINCAYFSHENNSVKCLYMNIEQWIMFFSAATMKDLTLQPRQHWHVAYNARDAWWKQHYHQKYNNNKVIGKAWSK